MGRTPYEISDEEMGEMIEMLEHLADPAPPARVSTEDQVALIDLDGTVADYDTSHDSKQRSLQAPGEPPYSGRYVEGLEPSHITARRKLIQAQPGFWENLDIIPAGMEVVELLRTAGFRLHVLTKGPMGTPSAWSEKVNWCKKHLSDALVTVGSDKSLVFGRVLFDDFPPYFLKWLAVRPRGLVICLARPWNEGFRVGGEQYHPNVIRYNGINKDQVTVRIQSAYARESGKVA